MGVNDVEMAVTYKEIKCTKISKIVHANADEAMIPRTSGANRS